MRPRTKVTVLVVLLVAVAVGFAVIRGRQKPGGPAVPKATLAEDTEEPARSERPPNGELSKEDEAEEVRQLQQQKKGELILVARYRGRKFYQYKYSLSTGTETTIGRDTPYLGTEEAVFEEVDALLAEGGRELIRGTDRGMSVYIVTLGDGRKMTYKTDVPVPDAAPQPAGGPEP